MQLWTSSLPSGIDLLHPALLNRGAVRYRMENYTVPYGSRAQT
jgi:hypothetical protein